jgi:hypothetical protein
MTEHNEQWFVDMGNAIKARDHAIASRAKWDLKVTEAETAIRALSYIEGPSDTETPKIDD